MPNDPCQQSAKAFDKLADRYQDAFMDLSHYEASYRFFCDQLRLPQPRVLDVACGPGNSSRFLLDHCPDIDLLGIDLAPRMIELARKNVPEANFLVYDCRQLEGLEESFDGIFCAFGLPYLQSADMKTFIESCSKVLNPQGLLYLSTMLGKPEDSGFQSNTSGIPIHLTYHREADLLKALSSQCFELLIKDHLASPETASMATTDLILIARKRS